MLNETPQLYYTIQELKEDPEHREIIRLAFRISPLEKSFSEVKHIPSTTFYTLDYHKVIFKNDKSEYDKVYYVQLSFKDEFIKIFTEALNENEQN